MKLTADIVERCCRTELPGYNPWAGADGFVFDVEHALRACEFIQERCTLTTGRWLGQPFDLQPWQVAIIGNIHGWRRKSDCTRRYRKCLITTARKSSKSHVAAGLALYHLFAEGEADPSIVSTTVASSRGTATTACGLAIATMLGKALGVVAGGFLPPIEAFGGEIPMTGANRSVTKNGALIVGLLGGRRAVGTVRRGDRVEDGLKRVRRAGNDLQDLGDRGLSFERALRLVEEPYVLDRDRGLPRECLYQPDLMLGEGR